MDFRAKRIGNLVCSSAHSINGICTVQPRALPVTCASLSSYRAALKRRHSSEQTHSDILGTVAVCSELCVIRRTFSRERCIDWPHFGLLECRNSEHSISTNCDKGVISHIRFMLCASHQHLHKVQAKPCSTINKCNWQKVQSQKSGSV